MSELERSSEVLLNPTPSLYRQENGPRVGKTLAPSHKTVTELGLGTRPLDSTQYFFYSTRMCNTSVPSPSIQNKRISTPRQVNKDFSARLSYHEAYGPPIQKKKLILHHLVLYLTPYWPCSSPNIHLEGIYMS